MTDLEAAVQLLGGPTNKVIYDDAGLPSIMVFFEAKTITDTYRGLTSDTLAPAFKVNGNNIAGFYLSKYSNVIVNNRAYSLPLQDVGANMTYTLAYNFCKNKGPGWHLWTNAERAYISAASRYIDKYQPGGNNYNGVNILARYETGINASKGNVMLTGSGPVTWNHNGKASGVCDLAGNIFEFIAGIRTVNGEIQVIVDNNVADTNNPESAASTLWKAISSTGTLITPNGDGRTANALKYMYDEDLQKICIDTIEDTYCKQIQKPFSDTYTTLDMSDLLILLGIYPDTAEKYNNQCTIINTSLEEGIAASGASYGSGNTGGLATLRYTMERNKYISCGVRSAYIAELAEQ